MQKEILKSNKQFTLYDYFVSHGQLLIRSRQIEGHPNIDIIFFDTTFLQLFAWLPGLTIRIAHKQILSDYPTVNKYLSYPNSCLFEIESGESKYYVAASFVRVFENNLAFNETSLGMEHKGREKEIAGS